MCYLEVCCLIYKYLCIFNILLLLTSNFSVVVREYILYDFNALNVFKLYMVQYMVCFGD